MPKLPQILTDAPVTQLMNWAGFSAKKDKTMLPANFLVEPSQSCFIPDGDKVIPREGTQVVFQGGTPVLNDGTIGKYTKFKNFFAIEMDVKAYRDAIAGEQVLVLFNNVYVPITINPNTALNGTDRIYFSTYTETSLDLSQDKRIPRLCWVNGYEDPSTGTGRVFSWTGGISPISTVVGNIITIPVGQTFRKLGFTENFPNTTQVHVTINGVNYFSTSVAELDTNSLTLNAPPVAIAGDIVTSSVEVDNLAAPMYMLKQNKNYMYYGNLMLRQWWMSNQFNRPDSIRITSAQAANNDLIIRTGASYTGTTEATYTVTIDSTYPPETIFTGSGANGLIFDILGYTDNGDENTYKVIVYQRPSTSDNTIIYDAATGIFWTGEVVTGGTSGATGVVVYDNTFNKVALTMIIGGPFVSGEVITGGSSGVTATVASFGPDESNFLDLFYRAFRNGIQVNSGPLQDATGAPIAGPFPIIDGITFDIPLDIIGASYPVGLGPYNQYQGYLQSGDTWEISVITNAAADTFKWQKNGGALSSSTAITGNNQTLSDGVAIKFGNKTGHTVGDTWIITAIPRVTRSWANFYYALDLVSQNSARRPGEGYVYNLPANFWTMDTFEDSIYVNTSNGGWGYSTPTLSADLLSEDITFTPLKQVTASKVLYPYLTGHNRNDLLFIDENKNLTSIGRVILMEKVQMEDMSDFVRNIFTDSTFVGGSIIFQDDKTWITSPEDNRMLCFDDRTKYWQPPQFIPNLGLLTIIGTSLYTHSYLNTATRSLNDPTAIGDDGVEYEVIARSSTFAHGDRWNKKETNMAFWEGYVDEAPPMKMKVYFDVDGCSGIEETNITPVYCTDVVNNGNFGGGQDGGHEFGGDETHRTNYARYPWYELGVHHFYFSSLEFRCRTKKHTYEMLSMGINLAQSKFNNKEWKTPLQRSIDQTLPL